MKTAYILASMAGLAITSMASADIYGPGGGGAIPDATTSQTAPGTLNSTINVVNANNIITSLNSVTVTFGNTNHAWVGDLVLTLTAPNGDAVHLMSRTGNTTATGFGDSSDAAGPYVFVNSGGADFTAAATVAGAAAVVPDGTYNRFSTSGTAVPAAIANTYAVFVGDDLNGIWTLKVQDFGAGDTGGLASWSMDMSSVPTPGAAALLGLGGLLAARRRRA